MQTEIELRSNTDLTDYYNSLTKKDKSKLLDFLFQNYGMRTNTLTKKLRGNYNGPIRKVEREVIFKVIKDGTWKN